MAFKNEFKRLYNRKLNNINIKKKMIISFSIIIVVMTFALISEVGFSMYNSNNFRYILKYYGFSQGDIGKLNSEFQKSGSLIRDRINARDDEKIKKLDANIMTSEINIENYMKKVSKTINNNESKEINDNIQNYWEEYKLVSQKVRTLAKLNKYSEAYELFSDEGTKISDLIGNDIERLFDLNISNGNMELNNIKKIELLFIGITTISIILSIVISIFISKKIVNDISISISMLVKAAEKISNGDFNIEINYPYEDEIGILAKTFSKTIYTLKIYITEITSILNNIANGNLDIEIKEDYKGEFIKIKDSLNNIVFSLNDLLGNINVTASRVANGSAKMVEESKKVSEASINQSNSVEELLQLMSYVSNKITENEKNSISTIDITNQVLSEIREGNNKILNMIYAIDEISESSNEIGKVIDVIEDVSMQTNILSINASIEAGRAGEFGKGFEVVAKEVGNLAAKSSQAVTSTKNLINKSIYSVDNGIGIAKETSEKLLLIVEDTNKSTKFINEIAKASGQQSQSIVNAIRVVEKISEIVEKNSIIAQESSLESVELSDQAKYLKDVVKKFKLKSNCN